MADPYKPPAPAQTQCAGGSRLSWADPYQPNLPCRYCGHMGCWPMVPCTFCQFEIRLQALEAT